jgi:iron-sulfur cluster assembly protein
MIQPTPAALSHVRDLLADRPSPGLGLRLWVEKGGCAGWQYAMTIGSAQEGDTTQEVDGVSFFIPEDSLPHLRGISLDYVDSLHDAGFKLANPNAARSCGCGTSFEPAAPGSPSHAA